MRHMKHGLAKPRCTLTMSDKTKVQALLKSHPSDNMRKGLKYLTQCARVWDPKHPAKTGLMPPYHWRHTPSLQARLLYRDMPPTPSWCGSVKIPHTQPLLAISAGAWKTCSPRLSALLSLNMNPHEGSSSRNSPRMMGPTIPSTISCIIGSS